MKPDFIVVNSEDSPLFIRWSDVSQAKRVGKEGDQEAYWKLRVGTVWLTVKNADRYPEIAERLKDEH